METSDLLKEYSRIFQLAVNHSAECPKFHKILSDELDSNEENSCEKGKT